MSKYSFFNSQLWCLYRTPLNKFGLVCFYCLTQIAANFNNFNRFIETRMQSQKSYSATTLTKATQQNFPQI